MIKKRLFYIFLGILSAGIAFGDVIKSGSLQAFSDGVNVTVNWVTENEANIVSYEILRSTNYNGGFSAIATLLPKGPSVYEYIDNSAFKKTTTIYFYRIKINYSNAQSYFPALNEPPITVNHNVSGVRRTWGSIKAMFR